MENRQDLLANEVVGAQLSSYWAHRWLEESGYELIITNSIQSTRYNST